MINLWALASRAAVAATLIGAAGIARAMSGPVARFEPSALVVRPVPPGGVPEPAAAPALALIRGRNPFRASRRSAAIAFRAETTTARANAAPAVVRPTLLLTGIAVGGHAVALLEGFPGSETPRLLAPGDSYGGFTLHAVFEDSALIRYRDTAMVVRLRRTVP